MRASSMRTLSVVGSNRVLRMREGRACVLLDESARERARERGIARRERA